MQILALISAKIWLKEFSIEGKSTKWSNKTHTHAWFQNNTSTAPADSIAMRSKNYIAVLYIFIWWCPISKAIENIMVVGDFRGEEICKEVQWFQHCVSPCLEDRLSLAEWGWCIDWLIIIFISVSMSSRNFKTWSVIDFWTLWTWCRSGSDWDQIYYDRCSNKSDLKMWTPNTDLYHFEAQLADTSSYSIFEELIESKTLSCVESSSSSSSSQQRNAWTSVYCRKSNEEEIDRLGVISRTLLSYEWK